MTTEAQSPASTATPWRAPAAPPHRGEPRSAGTGWIWAMSGLLFTLYAVVSIRRHERILSTGYDLGLVEQAVRSYASGHGPTAELKGPGASLLGDHFSPILAVLAPFYRVFPTPVTLLVAQALLLAVAVVPIASFTQQVLGRRAAVVIGLGYGLSWGVAQAVGFDVHEVAFAVPLMAFCVVALADRRMTAAVLWATPMLLVKEDLGLTVVMVGALVAWGGRRALGLATVAFATVATMVEVLIVLPANTPEGTFSAWWDAHKGGGAGAGLGSSLERVTVGLISPEPKALMLVLLVAPTAMLALRSPLLLLVVPTLLWRLGSDYPNYWGTGFHYSVALMPVVFVAFADALRRWSRPEGAARTREALMVSALVTGLLLPSYPLWSAVSPGTWKSETRVRDARAVLVRVPDGAVVSASNRLVPQLAGRTQVSLFGHPSSRPNPEWIVVDGGRPTNWPFTSGKAQADLVAQAKDLGYAPVVEQGDFVLLHRDPGDTRQFPAPPPPEPEPLPTAPGPPAP